MTVFGIVWRQALRDWRLGEMRILASALIVAVASVTAVALFTDRLLRTMEIQAAELLAADLVVVSSTPPRQLLRDQARAMGLRTAISSEFPSVILVGEDTLLVQVKAVEDGYPLRGVLRIKNRIMSSPQTVRNGPNPGQAWVEARLLEHFNLPVGAEIDLGESRLEATKVLDYEPDRGGQLFQLAPRVLINMRDVGATGLISRHSRVRYRMLVAGDPEQIDSYRQWLDARLRPDEQLRGVRDARPEVRSALQRVQRYLGLCALLAVLVAGMAVALAARHFAERQHDASAILRCLGARRSDVIKIYVLRLLLFGLLASALGCAIGYLAQMGLDKLLQGLFLEARSSPGIGPIITGLLTGLLALLGFAIPPILRLTQVPPMLILRREMSNSPPSTWLSLVLAVAAFAAMLLAQSWDTKFTLQIVLGAGVAIACLWGVTLTMIMILQRIRLPWGMVWRFGITRLIRRRISSVLQICGFAVGISALLVLAITRVDLLRLWQDSLPANAPNHFLVNIQHDEKDSVDKLLSRYGLVRNVYFPIVRGRLTGINDREIAAEDYQSQRAKRILNRELFLTWIAQLQADNKIMSGRWWDESGGSVREFSIESSFADTLGIQLGDTLRFKIAGAEIDAKVSSIRKVEWDSFNPNFFVIAAPGLLADSPATYVSSVYLETGQNELIAELVRRFPSITVIDVGTLLSQLHRIMDRAALAIEFVFVFTLLAGMLLMYAALQASQLERRHEIALLRTFGASHTQLFMSLVVEFLAIGVLAGGLAASVASLAGFLLATEVFGFHYQINPWLWFWGVAGGGIGITLAGLMGSWRVARQRPHLVIQHTLD